MLSYILYLMQEFERNHGAAPNVIYINPMHFEALFRENPALFEPGQAVRLGFRMVMLPSSCLPHPEASRLEIPRTWPNCSHGTVNQASAWRLPVVA
jgi:hypothetical protein